MSTKQLEDAIWTLIYKQQEMKVCEVAEVLDIIATKLESVLIISGRGIKVKYLHNQLKKLTPLVTHDSITEKEKP